MTEKNETMKFVLKGRHVLGILLVILVLIFDYMMIGGLIFGDFSSAYAYWPLFDFYTTMGYGGVVFQLVVVVVTDVTYIVMIGMIVRG